jgi:hypothetical protein
MKTSGGVSFCTYASKSFNGSYKMLSDVVNGPAAINIVNLTSALHQQTFQTQRGLTYDMTRLQPNAYDTFLKLRQSQRLLFDAASAPDNEGGKIKFSAQSRSSFVILMSQE